MSKVWCRRDLVIAPVHIGLCTTEELMEREFRSLHIPERSWPEKFMNANADATTHKIKCFDGRHCAIVFITPPEFNVTGIGIASLLVHEAVHIWNWSMELIGESDPSDEFSAYGIQAISQELMERFAEQTGVTSGN